MEQLKKPAAPPESFESLGAILGVKDLSVKPIWVEAWKATCYLREMSGMQVGYFASLATLVDDADAVQIPVERMAEIVTMCLCDRDGQLIGPQPGDEHFEADARKLADKSSDAILALFMGCVELSKLGAAQIEDAQKKLEADR